jgi:ABC-2 type transport system ATP-binding protein
MVDLAADAAPGASGAAESPAWVAVAGLGKSFAGGTRALHEVSFAARPGEVLGLLGENGAGKTTALRILAGYLKPSAGTAQVAGFDVVDEPLAARAQVGYLPEQVPLPRELRVREYLRYRAELKGVTAPRRALDSLLDEVLAAVGLEREQRRLLAQLSKGYRQRVGLADALLHRPKVLLLDEPTDGLDPNQRREVLQLIARLGQAHAVILSTHVLPEIESVCQRVVILSRGRVAAQGTLAELLARLQVGGRLEVLARGDQAALLAALQQAPGVAAVKVLPAGEPEAAVHRFVVELTAKHGPAEAQAREQVARAVLAAGELRELLAPRSPLDAVFRFLTAASGDGPPAPSAAPP